MVDFSKLLKSPPKPQPTKYDIQDIREDCYTGKSRTANLKWYIEKQTKWPDLTHAVFIEGGPTGWESFCVDRFWEDTQKRMCASGWYACAGTPRSWDSLFIPPEEARKMINKIKELIER